MKRFRRLLILTVLLGSLITLAMPSSGLAEFTCDLDANAGNQACALYYSQCLADGYSPSVCRGEYSLCLTWAGDARESCEAINGDPGQPWPVIEQHLSWCLQGCQDCNQITDSFDNFNCLSQCSDFCEATYPKL